jgi:SAM-dependent methyltransferase
VRDQGQRATGRGGDDPFGRHVGQYEAWFKVNQNAYQAEIRAIEPLMGPVARGVEIGVGTGRFAAPLGIALGLDPSLPMLRIARMRGIEVAAGVGESLPLPDSYFDLALMVTTVCFLESLHRSFLELRRILKHEGTVIVGLVDRASTLGREYLGRKDESVFYRSARFYTVMEIVEALSKVGFQRFDYRQTLFVPLAETLPSEPVRSGFGDGSFVAIRARALSL